MSKPTLYKIYYGNDLIYVGRTNQKLQNRIHGHLFKKPMHRDINIFQVTRIEYVEMKTVADMYLYEIYLINLLKPILNRDDKAQDKLTFHLPELEWKEFETPLWEKWKEKCSEIIEEERRRKERGIVALHRERNLKMKRRAGEIGKEEYRKELEAIRGR